MADFTIKKGDRLPSLSVQLLDASGVPVDLTGRTAEFLMRAEAATLPKVEAAATIDDAAQGKVSYSWAALDVDTVGKFRGEFRITTVATGKIQTVPANGYLEIEVVANLDT